VGRGGAGWVNFARLEIHVFFGFAAHVTLPMNNRRPAPEFSRQKHILKNDEIAIFFGLVDDAAASAM
jgi:hypothetical protein